MSATQLDNEQTNASRTGPFSFIANTYMHSDSINEASASLTPVVNNNGNSSTWVESLTCLDRLLCGSLLRLCYLIIDIILLILGLYYGKTTCISSSKLVSISITILVFGSLELAAILIYFIRNWTVRQTIWSGEREPNGILLRNLLHFLRFICICIGTGFVFSSKAPLTNDCEILRFYLGIVCFGTFAVWFIPPCKALLPVRRSLVSEIIIRLVLSIGTCFYLGFVIYAMLKVNSSECVYKRIEDLYFHAPLKSFAFIGLLLTGCILGDRVLDGIINQLFYRLPRVQKLILYLSAIRYMIAYLITIFCVYYFSVGAVLLFQPRSGSSCRQIAPGLYKTLFVWQIICVFWPIIIWPLACLICCLGVAIGTCIAQCLPASITVPILEMIEQRLPAAAGTTYANPPASQNMIDALPDVIFGQTTDEFDQKECVICRMEYEPNEQVKKLPCGHLFHANCVTRWLVRTRVCPTCRQRITSDDL
ncbi:hypothetical protein I4U23_012119 [Adineta vaga]|nr:hypothetical protein I4U23_012119 [Adineta vaga]